MPTCRVLYEPIPKERTLISFLLREASSAGYEPALLPPIHLTTEIPPFFLLRPDLDPDGVETSSRDNDAQPQTSTEGVSIPIDELLGLYSPRQGILLYERGLRWVAAHHFLDRSVLQSVVLIHECGHWLTHMLPKPGTRAWPEELYLATQPEVHEGWAQLMTAWVARVAHQGCASVPRNDFESTFEVLNRHQSAKYHVYRQFESLCPTRVMQTLEWLRQLYRPASLADWKTLLDLTSGP